MQVCDVDAPFTVEEARRVGNFVLRDVIGSVGNE
jgi:hypothetical protein